MRRKLNVKLAGIILATVLVASGAVYFLHGWQLRENAYRLLERGDLAMQQDDWEKAELYYSQYLPFVPDDVDTAQKYAEVLDRIGSDRVQVVVNMEQVLRVKPNEAALRLRLVHNLISLNRIAEATEHLKKLLRHEKDNSELLHMLGWCQDAKKDFPQAVTSFREAVKLTPKQIKSWVLLTEVLQDRLNQPDEALQAMNAMVSANFDSFRAHLLRAQFHRRRSEEKEAAQDLQAAQKLEPYQPEVILEVADWLKAKGSISDAVATLKDGQKRYPQNADFDMRLAVLKIQGEKSSEAIGHLQEGLRKSPKSHELAVLLIDLLIGQGQFTEAREKLRQLTDTGLRPILANYLTARLDIADGHWDEAIKLLEGVRQDLGPSSEWNSRVHMLLGVCYRKTGDPERELLAFRRAVSHEPNWMAANLGLSGALLRAGRVEEAVNLLEPLQAAKAPPAGYWLLLAKGYLEQSLRTGNSKGPWDKIEKALTNAEHAQPDPVELAVLQAEVLAAKKNFTGAEKLLAKAQSEHPESIEVWCALADLSVRQNQWDAAEAVLDQVGARKEFADRVEWRLAKARLLSRRARDEDLAKLARLAEQTPATVSGGQRGLLTRELADTWYRLGDWNRAERLWRDLATAMPKDLRSRACLLELALEKNQGEAARRCLNEIRKIEGEQGSLWRYATAAILVRESRGRPEKLEEARKLLKELTRFHQDWPRIALLSATISELQGEYQNAIQEYSRALDQGEMSPRMMARLLELLLARHEYSKAETELAKYEQKVPLTRGLARLGAEIAVGTRDKDNAKVALRRADLAVPAPVRDYRDALWLARICLAAGENARAEKLLRESVETAGHTPDTWLALIELLTLSNRKEQANIELDRLRKVLPPDRLPLTLARALDIMHRVREAGVAYEAALRGTPKDFTVLDFAADFYRRSEQPDEARRVYETLLLPEMAAPAAIAVKARRRLSVLLAQSGSPALWKKARTLIDENTKLRGDTIADARIRFFIQGQDDRQSARAISKFQESLKREIPTTEERLLLAQLLEAKGSLGQARSHLSEIVDQYPTAPQYLFPFGRVLVKLGEFQEAQTIIARLERLESGSSRVLEAKSALERAQQKPASSVSRP